jgi:hypothetical protein
MKKKNFQYECAIKFQQHVQMKGSTRYLMRQSFSVPQPCFDPLSTIKLSTYSKSTLHNVMLNKLGSSTLIGGST